MATDREIDRYEMFKRVQDLGGVHASAFPANSPGAAKLTILAEVIETLDAQTVAHASSISSTRQNAAEKKEAYDAVYEELRAISLSAQMIERDLPGFANKFRLPSKGSYQAFINAARTIAADAATQAAEFAKTEMPANFLVTLNTKIQALEDAMERKNVNAEAQVAARTTIREAIKRGMRAAQELNAIVRNKFRDDTVLLAEWEHAFRVTPVKRKAAPPAAPAATPVS
jgi:hypothetical protein